MFSEIPTFNLHNPTPDLALLLLRSAEGICKTSVLLVLVDLLSRRQPLFLWRIQPEPPWYFDIIFCSLGLTRRGKVLRVRFSPTAVLTPEMLFQRLSCDNKSKSSKINHSNSSILGVCFHSLRITFPNEKIRGDITTFIILQSKSSLWMTQKEYCLLWLMRNFFSPETLSMQSIQASIGLTDKHETVLRFMFALRLASES